MVEAEDSFIDVTDRQMQMLLLREAFETGDFAHIAQALGAIARARGMSNVSRLTGLRRESLYQALSVHGNPKLSTILAVFKALGFSISVSQSRDAADEIAELDEERSAND